MKIINEYTESSKESQKLAEFDSAQKDGERSQMFDLTFYNGEGKSEVK